MPENPQTVLLSDVLSLPDGKGINKSYVDIVLEEEIPVLCLNRKTKKERLMPFKVLRGNNEVFWRQGGEWEYFLTEESLEKLKKKAIEKNGAWEFKKPGIDYKSAAENEEELEELEVEVGYGSEYETFAGMPVEKKIEWLDKNKQRLNSLLIEKSRDTGVVIEALVDTTKDAALINHVILADASKLGNEEAKKITQSMVDSTYEMVKSSVQLVMEDYSYNNELMSTLVKKSNGTIIQHMVRVYLKGVAFIAYYNNFVTMSSSIQKFRLSFAANYRKFYHALLPHLDVGDVTLEHVFFGGMRAVPVDLFYKWSVGFLIHDIGKAAAIEYHEGEAAYDRDTVVEHVKAGYQSVVSKTNYPMEAGLITGYHHEYYGSSDGYGYFRAYLQQYKKHNPEARQDYCITYELEPMIDYQALAYFPAKVLEIIDVFDSLTDPNRVYRKAMSTEEALEMMRKEFVEKRKIDAILFDIFSLFIRE